jgi:hypothetical protein
MGSSLSQKGTHFCRTRPRAVVTGILMTGGSRGAQPKSIDLRGRIPMESGRARSTS